MILKYNTGLRPVLCLVLSLVMGLWMMALGPMAGAETPNLQQPPSSPLASDDEILVIGQRAGPRMWRIEKEDAEIFVLVSVSHLPEDFEWNSLAVRNVLEDSVEVLTMPKANLSAGDRTRLIGTMLRTLIFSRGRLMMPKNVTLADRVGEDLAGQFERARARIETRKALQKEKRKLERKQRRDQDVAADRIDKAETPSEQSLTKEDDELVDTRLKSLKPGRMHPFIQAQSLVGDAIDSAGLQSFTSVQDEIEKLAKKVERRPKPKVRPILSFDVAFRDVKTILKRMKSFSDETNRVCMEESIDFAENTLFDKFSEAHAWARGDGKYLRQVTPEVLMTPCERAVSDEIGSLKTFGDKTLDQLDIVGLWTDEIVKRLEEPGVRLAIIPASAWLRPGGAMDQLLEQGVKVEGP